jgi:putative transposase
MSSYRRSLLAGGTYFFTVALANRQSKLLVEHVDQLRKAYDEVNQKLPFDTVAICVLPDHLHAIWALPPDDANYPTRWSLIKSGFSRTLPPNQNRSASKLQKREKGIWQRRYWEHQIKNEADLEHHVHYIYYNPIKHGLVQGIADWPHSSFHRDVKRGLFPKDWMATGEPDGKYGE